MATALVILAAGKGSRMKSDFPKTLHQIADAPMLHHVMQSGQVLDPERIVVVAGHGGEAVSKAAKTLNPDAQIVLQEDQLGTGHAVDQARDALKDFDGDVVVLYGDTPFLKPQTIQRIVAARADHDIVVLGFELPANEPRYGRLVMEGDKLARIVEYKDASEAEREILFCNSGIIACNAKALFTLLGRLSNDNASGEYYLTDIVAHGNEAGLSVTAIACDRAETLGVDSRANLAEANAIFQEQARAQLLEDGVTLIDPSSVILSWDTVIGRDCVIEPNVVFGPGVTIESGAHIRAFSHLEGCHVARGAVIGPYARLRPGAELSEDVRVGNFVEIKNALIAQGAKINHLSYIGDAQIGAEVNIGAGTITCNYDGVMKHKTEIGDRAFIGSNTMLVAPVKIGAEALTGSGSVITKDVEDGALALGRAQQVSKPGFARKLRETLLRQKAQKANSEPR